MTEPYKRLCPNWLLSFKDWTYNRSEAPDSYIIWAGLYALAAACRRQIKVGKEFLGSWECTPHLYVIFVGPPGGPRKTTTIEYAYELLEKLPITRGPDIVSQAALMTKLVESADNSVYITSHEFSDLIMKSGPEMYAFLTSMFDGKKSIEATTISRGAEFANKPCINMIAATTPVWVSENMGEDVIGGGFASRVVFVYEDKARQRRFFHKHKDNNFNLEDTNKLGEALAKDLGHIATINGDFKLEQSALDFLEYWYQTEVDKPRARNLQGYFNRKHTHLLKVCQLVHIAYSDDLTLTLEDAQLALTILNQVEAKLPNVFRGVGKNEFIFDIHAIIKFVAENKKVQREQLFEAFESSATPENLMRLIDSLVVIKKLKVTVDDKIIFYEIP